MHCQSGGNADESEALVIANYVLPRSASDNRVLGAFCERADLIGLIFARSCVAASEIGGDKGRCPRTSWELSTTQPFACPYSAGLTSSVGLVLKEDEGEELCAGVWWPTR